jgi:hypothetical protein
VETPTTIPMHIPMEEHHPIKTKIILKKAQEAIQELMRNKLILTTKQ